MSGKKAVKVPEKLQSVFIAGQKLVAQYFRGRKDDPFAGKIEIGDQRYILIRAASLSVEFFEAVRKLFSDRSEKEAVALARDLLFDIAHAIGMADAKNFHALMKLRTPLEKISVGPVHFAYSGWGFVDLLPESNLVADENFVLVYDHPHSFESQAWRAAGRKTEFPVCVMNAGYSSGWCEESFGVPLVAAEILCQAKGDRSCRFIMVPPERINEQVAAYVKKHARISPGWDRFEDTGFFKKKKFEDERRQREVKRSEHLQRALYSITDAAQSASSLESLCAAIHAIIGELMPARNFYIALYEPETDFLRFPYWVDECDESPPLEHPGKGLTEYVLRTGQPLLAAPEVFERLARSGEVVSIGAPSLDWLGVPLKTKTGETIGVMTVQTYSHEVRYGEAEKSILEFVSTQVAMVIERMRADEARRQSEERYRRIVDNAPVGILTADRKGRIIDINPVLLRILGSPSAEATKEINLLTFPPLVAAGIAADLETCMSESRLITGEYPYRSKWGKETFMRAQLVPILDRAGAIAGVMGIIEDFTEHRKMEEERRNLGERLRHMEKMEAIGTLAGGVAHDLNNVLGVLSGYAELLQLETRKDSPMRAHADKILKSSERGAAIIQDLLTLARRGVANSEVTNLNRIIGDYLKSPEFQKLSELYPQLRVEQALAPDLLNVMGSPVHLGKTLMNLVLNAAEAIPAAGTVSIRTWNLALDKADPRFADMKNGDYAVLAVSDTGIGIPAAEVKRIFEPFYSRKTLGRSGTGLGLAVVWGTIKDHNGYIDVHSVEGEGSTFTLYFPVTRESRRLDRPPISLAQYMGRGESILVVDDMAEQREVAAAMLEKAGYRVQTVSGGLEALAHLERHGADLVILDMIMDPGMDGLETFRRLRKRFPLQKAIIVSGYAETGRAREALKLGAGAYVQKPFVMEKICQAVRSELDRPAASEPPVTGSLAD